MTGPHTSCFVLALFLAGGLGGCAPGVAGYDEPGADLGLYDTWDADDSGLLDENELYAGTFDTWDTDDDGLLSADEFGLGTGWFDDTTFGAFDTWDVDSSGLIDNDEFYDGVANLGV